MRNFWQEALAQAAGGMILAAVGGIGFLCYSLPRQLDQVIQSQKVLTERFGAIEERVQKVEGDVNNLQIKVTRFEAR
jgi:hypothetical protein